MNRFAHGLIGLALLVAPSVAQAQDESLDAAAEARFKDGVALAKRGKYEQARGSFLQTLALSPGSPKVLLNLAISEHGAGRPVDALGHLKIYLASPKVDAKKAQEVRQSLYEELWRATGHLRITADRGDALVLDGETKLGNAPLADLVDVTPGKHQVAAGARSSDIEVAGGETKEVSLVAPPTASPPVETRTTPSVVEPPAEEKKSTFWAPLTFVLGGATLVAGGVAVYFNSRSFDAAERADALRTEHAGASCAGAAAGAFCNDLREANSDQDSAASISRAVWIGGGVLLAGTIASGVLWATSRSSSRTGSIVPIIGPGSAGATYRFAF